MKNDPLKAATAGAVLRMLEPLAQLLLEVGMGVGEVQALTELAFVSAARRDHLEAGESDPENVARIAVRTGLPRGTVMQLLAAKPDENPRLKPFLNKANRVLSAWCTEPDYIDEAGLPLVLPIRGVAPSFQALVKLSSGDELSRTILKDLQRVGAVKRLPNNCLQVVRRSYARMTWNKEILVAFGEELREHLRTLLYNLQRREPSPLHRYIVNAELDEKQAAILEREFTGQADSLFDAFSSALNHETVAAAPNATRKNRLSASICILREPVLGSPVRSASGSARTRRKKKPSARK